MAVNKYENLIPESEDLALNDSARIVTADGKSQRALFEDVATLVVEEFEDSGLDTTDKTIVGAINELAGETSGRITEIDGHTVVVG